MEDDTDDVAYGRIVAGLTTLGAFGPGDAVTVWELADTLRLPADAVHDAVRTHYDPERQTALVYDPRRELVFIRPDRPLDATQALSGYVREHFPGTD